MSETRNWDEYFVRVESYLESKDIESEELNYKRETAQELARYRETLLARPGPISIQSNANLANLCGWRTLAAFLQWLAGEDGTVALRDLWSREDQSPETVPPAENVIERVRRFSRRMPTEILRGPGGRMRPISVLLMALDAEQYPAFMTSAFKSAYTFTGFEEPIRGAEEADLYAHALRFLDRFIEEAVKRARDTPGNRLEAQSLVWALNQGRDAPAVSPDGHDETDNHIKRPDPDPASSFTEIADQLLLPVDFLRNIETLIRDKRQVIFQGPPGTGKTYVARKLADWLAGANERVRLVQFHPSYAYEDFVQGFRPSLGSGQPGFELRNGPLIEVAKQARASPDRNHFLVIDEINRGNLAKVFGELYFLLEYRDAELRLLYSDKPFTLPKNLFIIGTMNTADRSIALVDLALRRRFHFVEFHPDRPPVRDLLSRWLELHASDMTWVAAVVERANEKLDDRQAAIGPSYFMKRDLDDDMVRLIWEHNVLPYVEEHLYGETQRLAEFGLDRLRHEVDGDGAESDDPGVDDGDASSDADG